MLKCLAAATAAMALSAPAGAADLPQAPPFPAPASIWTGFHVGAEIGGAGAHEDGTTTFFGAPAAFSTSPSGTIGGLAFGYDYQFSANCLVGADLALSWSSARASFNSITATAPAAFSAGMLTTNHNWYDIFTGRVGYVLGNWVLYGKGGVAWINATYGLAFANRFPAARSQAPAPDTISGWAPNGCSCRVGRPASNTTTSASAAMPTILPESGRRSTPRSS